MEGLNITAKIYRQTQGTDDDYGGSTRTETLIYSSVKCRIGPKVHVEDYRVVGIESPRELQAIIYPGNLTIKEEDILVPESGTYQDIKFLITAILKDSIKQNNKRSHLEIYLSRIEESRSRY